MATIEPNDRFERRLAVVAALVAIAVLLVASSEPPASFFALVRPAVAGASVILVVVS
jgi:hypothetical protein